jgi:hypothetical protein
VEIDVKNAAGELLPGAYAEAHFNLPSSAHTYLLPVPALIFRSEGLQIATVDENQRAVLKHIELGRDFGTQVEVVSGLNQNDLVITNPPDSLISGEAVRAVTQSNNDQEQAGQAMPSSAPLSKTSGQWPHTAAEQENSAGRQSEGSGRQAKSRGQQ